MATKTFSGRAEEELLAHADAVTQRDCGMSFGQFCGTQVASYIFENNALPELGTSATTKEAFATLRSIARSHGGDKGKKVGDPSIGKMTDREIKDLIAGKYA